ncbi:MAG: hypothetical protein IOB85_10140 [Methylobacterium sp.]|nr:hypothetical protein [Cupriavidus sp.]MCA3671910.1 hypothetical protein [Methylobacterium sp.]MCA3676856.1 hypothetical protein [Methylobacterium sp.]MCA3681292.1 hypothetical protein [Methylobacterium sp.]MCA3682604.1 hypothetical protein [Methylobacterium sp.]
MKKLFKSLAIAGLATGALLSTAGLASAQQFNVVIDKIELAANGDAVPVTVYQPSAGVAATATTTIDLFNASQKLGVRLPIAAPQAGTYNTMLVTFASMQIVSGTTTRDLMPELRAARVLGTDLQGRGVLVMGECGGASGACADLGGAVSGGTIQPIVSTGLNTAISLPALNVFLPKSDFSIVGTQGVLRSTPAFVPVATEVTDNARRPNLTLGLKPFAFRTVTPTVTGNALPIRVGLFACAAGNDCAAGVTRKRPVVSRVVNLAVSQVTGTLVTDQSVAEVTLIDVPDGHFLPVAWRDANNNALWDDGEWTALVLANTTNAANILTVTSTMPNATYSVDTVSASTISSTRTAGTNGLGNNTNNGVTNTDNGFLGEVTLRMPSRTVVLDMTLANTAAETGPTTGIALVGDAGDLRLTNGTAGGIVPSGVGAAAVQGSMTMSVSMTNSISKTLLAGAAVEIYGLADPIAAATTTAIIAVSSTALAAVSDTALIGVRGTIANTTPVRISAVPMTSITTIGDLDAAVNKGSAGEAGVTTFVNTIVKSGVAVGTSATNNPWTTKVLFAASDNNAKAVGTIQHVLP